MEGTGGSNDCWMGWLAVGASGLVLMMGKKVRVPFTEGLENQLASLGFENLPHSILWVVGTLDHEALFDPSASSQ